jgi:15-cis-phytoene synthase
MEAVRANDRDRYLTALYAPAAKRDALFSLYAFNAEIAGVRERIREALPGEIRLQWWRDTIAADEGAGHPLAETLLKAINEHRLPRPAFDNYLDARIFDLYNDPMPSRTDLEGYCGETAGAVIQLSAMILDPAAAPGCAELAGRAGCAQAITGLLRLMPVHRARGQCFVPADILASIGSSPEEFVSGDGGPNAPRAVSAMVALGREHLAAFLAGAAKLPGTLRPAFLPLAPVGAYLDLIEENPERTLRVPVEIAAWKKQWLFFRHASRGWN